MTEKPILFSGPMVRAILEGRKTMTRRLLKPQITKPWGGLFNEGRKWWTGDSITGAVIEPLRIPYIVGDTLWVREKFCVGFDLDDNCQPVGKEKVFYAATYSGSWYDPDAEETKDSPPWKPSIHMPRTACRLRLRVTGVDVQRLQQISRGDAMEEGCPFPNMAAGPDPRDWYSELWDAINGSGSWKADPWVAAYRFERIT